MFLFSDTHHHILIGSYDLLLVVLAISISIVASAIAFYTANKISVANKKLDKWILIASSGFVMGVGMWAVHFISMLAFSSTVIAAYDVKATLFSILPSVLLCVAAMGLISKKNSKDYRLVLAASIVGCGSGLIYFLSTSAMQYQGYIQYHLITFASAMIVAIFLAYFALSINTNINTKKSRLSHLQMSTIAGAVMGASISMMHFIATSATYFVQDLAVDMPLSGVNNAQLQHVVMTVLMVAVAFYALVHVSYNKQLKNEANKNDHIFQELIKAVDDYAILVLDKSGYILTWNRGAERIKKYSSEEIIGQHFTVFYTKEDLESGQTATILGSALSSGRYEEECYKVKKDGSQFWAEVVICPIFDENGAHQGFSKVTRDITEKKLASKNREIAATIYRALGEAVLVVDAKNTIIAVNPAMSMLAGLAEEELLNQPVSIIESTMERQDSYQNIFTQADKTGCWQGEAWLRSKGIDNLNQWVAINNVYDSEGKLERRVVMFSKVTDQKIAEQTIWYQANFDGLTNLPNKQLLKYRLNQELIKAKRGDLKVAVLSIDLDRLKEVNDTLGHDFGDLLLQEVAVRLLKAVRHTDTVSRLAGDEFIVILSELKDLEVIHHICNKVLQSLKSAFYINNEKVFIGSSIGVTIYPDDSLNAHTLLKNADQAMNAAKKHGKNRFYFFTSELQESATLRMRLSNDMHYGLKDNQFKVVYQPIINLKNNEAYKAEALIRWYHPTLGFVGPAQFIGIAEENGFILQLDDWILSESIDRCSQWREKFHPNFKVSVNKSPIEFTTDIQLEHYHFAGLHKLKDQGGLVVIEITEGLLLRDELGVKDKLHDLRRLGVQIALDDFGTGYSSLSYLNKFDIDYIKIDQSFVRNLQENSRDYALCEAIIVMAHKLGAVVIAEGIETQEHFDLLKKAGCDYGQGYFISKPLAANEFEDWLLNNKSNQISKESVWSDEYILHAVTNQVAKQARISPARLSIAKS